MIGRVGSQSPRDVTSSLPDFEGTGMPLESSSSSLGLDDAFADSDEDRIEYNFSPEAIRAEMARRESSWATESDADSAPHSFEIDESVSTLDISGTRSQSPASEVDSTIEGDGSEANFSSISLGEQTDADGHVATAAEDDVVVGAQDQEVPEDSQVLDIHETHSYPNVLIDASKPPGHRVTVSMSTIAERTPTHSTNASSSRPGSRQSIHSPPPESNGHLPAASSSSQPIPPLPLPASPPGPPPVTPKTPSRPNRSTGPSMFEKVRSKTRPSFLPPKSKQEDNKHLSEWESMMKQSRLSAEKRRQALQDRRLAREKKIEDSLHVWEKEIVPDWKVVHKNPALKKLWWKGIPTKLRASMWTNAVGNALALSKDNYRICSTRAKRALAAGSFPSQTLSMIEEDMAATLPSLHIFHRETGPLYGDLRDMLCAWVVSRSDEGLGYAMGAAKIAAMMLLNMPVPQAFIVMRNLLERHCMRSFFGGEGSKADVDAYYRIFDTLLADGMPKIYFNFKQHQISPGAYLPGWIVPLFLDHLPFEACARLWDVILLEGDSFLYRASLGILAVLEPRLFFPDRQELLELLRGENKAALDVASREGRPLDGGKYEIYGVDEETLWDRLDGMRDWWKDSTWARLIQRELPDL
ncbi:unnamed protein product [Mycena citricolor]|uniref:Rab-GAP TBC domain-containing protein n=1 Tax=Mycena citricolor TaxID=2018698 RepID=A0AAD2HUA3_9AGAR|nr:unnamed protein product [Mycena citricolor]